MLARRVLVLVAMITDPYRRPAVAAEPESPNPRLWHVVMAVVIAAPLLAAAALLDRDVADGIRSLPEDDRDALYRRTTENVEMCNRRRVDALQSYCEAQRELLREFPECDATCEAIARAGSTCVRC